jgi:hypothetical protein
VRSRQHAAYARPRRDPFPGCFQRSHLTSGDVWRSVLAKGKQPSDLNECSVSLSDNHHARQARRVAHPLLKAAAGAGWPAPSWYDGSPSSKPSLACAPISIDWLARSQTTLARRLSGQAGLLPATDDVEGDDEAASGLLDTSVFIARETGRSLDVRLMPDESAVSAVTLAELQVGVLATSTADARAPRVATLQAVGDARSWRSMTPWRRRGPVASPARRDRAPAQRQRSMDRRDGAHTSNPGGHPGR